MYGWVVDIRSFIIKKIVIIKKYVQFPKHHVETICFWYAWNDVTGWFCFYAIN